MLEMFNRVGNRVKIMLGSNKTAMSDKKEEVEDIKLSEQAKWYLRGLKTTYASVNKVEPQAMKELVDKGLALEMRGSLPGIGILVASAKGREWLKKEFGD